MSNRRQVEPKKIRGIKALIAEGFEIETHIKELSEQLKDIKEKCKQHAAYREEHQLIGDYNKGVIVDDTSSASLDSRTLAGEVEMETFLDLVKPVLSKVREHLGEERFMEIAEITEYPYSRVTFGEVVDEVPEDEEEVA